MSGENELKPFDESTEFKKWFKDAEPVIELGDFSDRELLAMAWNAANQPGTERVPEGTMELLKSMEWSGRDRELDCEACPRCGWLHGDSGKYHHKDCELSAILTRHRATKETPNAQG